MREGTAGWTVLGLVALLLCSACEKDLVRSAAEIETAVRNHLSTRTDLRLDSMDVRADRIRYEGDRALASVSIMASDDPQASMTMMYELVHGPGGWQVMAADGAGSSVDSPSIAPGTSPDLPPGHPPLTQPGNPLPPGHPPTEPREGPLPPGHPPLRGDPR